MPEAHRAPSESLEVFALQSYEIADNWYWIERFLERIVDPGWTRDEVRDELEEAQAQLWGAHEMGVPRSIWITRIENTREHKRGLLWIAAGEPLDEGLSLFREHTEPWLKEKGCSSIYIVGRKGWGRVLDDYQEVGVMFAKELL